MSENAIISSYELSTSIRLPLMPI